MSFAEQLAAKAASSKHQHHHHHHHHNRPGAKMTGSSNSLNSNSSASVAATASEGKPLPPPSEGDKSITSILLEASSTTMASPRSSRVSFDSAVKNSNNEDNHSHSSNSVRSSNNNNSSNINHHPRHRNNNNNNNNNNAALHKEKAERYKSENKKLRKEQLLLKAKLEMMVIGNSHDEDLEGDLDALRKERDGLHAKMRRMEEVNKGLEIQLLEKEMGDLDTSDKRGGLSSEDSSDHSGGMSRSELLQENARLNELLEDVNSTQQLQQTKTEKELSEELSEVTDLKNAEIDVLRKQLNRVESKSNNTMHQELVDEKEKTWNIERNSLRKEIRRLNLEVSALNQRNRLRKSLSAEEDEINQSLGKYMNNANGSGPAEQYNLSGSGHLDNNDIASLQSIIGMMRQTIDQSNREKDLLERRLGKEQERSQMELKAFANTLEGVDDLRKSAEIMSREIRRIKVRGYRPTRSDLMGGGGGGLRGLDGMRNFGELTAAVEASESMDEAIRLIENQNDAMEERRRMGVVASSVSAAMASGSGAADGDAGNPNNGKAAAVPEQKKQGRVYGGGIIGLSAIRNDDDREGGFLSFWNTKAAAGGNADGEGEDGAPKKEERKKKSKRKKRREEGGGSVLTSFF